MKTQLVLVMFAMMFVGCGGGTSETQEAQTAPTETAPVSTTSETSGAEAAVEADPTDIHLEGDHLTVDHMIHFETGLATITADSTETLDHLALFISHHYDVIGHIFVVGHTDERGGDATNMRLSEERAAAVADALRQRGVTAMLESRGAGSHETLCSEDTDACHERNRRVEFIVRPPA